MGVRYKPLSRALRRRTEQGRGRGNLRPALSSFSASYPLPFPSSLDPSPDPSADPQLDRSARSMPNLLSPRVVSALSRRATLSPASARFPKARTRGGRRIIAWGRRGNRCANRNAAFTATGVNSSADGRCYQLGSARKWIFVGGERERKRDGTEARRRRW